VNGARSRWSERLRRPVIAFAVDPYTSGPGAIAAAGRKLAEADVDEVLLDCIGYTERHGSIVTDTGVRAQTARSLAVSAAVDALRLP
jgi:protein AroM